MVAVNLFLLSLFGQLDIDLNGRTISDGSSTYPYRAYLEKLLSYGEEAKSTHLAFSLFYNDTTGKMDEPNPAKANANANLELTKRASFASESKVVDIIGKFHGGSFNQRKIFVGYSESAFEVTSQ